MTLAGVAFLLLAAVLLAQFVGGFMLCSLMETYPNADDIPNKLLPIVGLTFLLLGPALMGGALEHRVMRWKLAPGALYRRLMESK